MLYAYIDAMFIMCLCHTLDYSYDMIVVQLACRGDSLKDVYVHSLLLALCHFLCL